jgi:hypothetical protein
VIGSTLRCVIVEKLQARNIGDTLFAMQHMRETNDRAQETLMKYWKTGKRARSGDTTTSVVWEMPEMQHGSRLVRGCAATAGAPFGVLCYVASREVNA